MTGAEQSAAWEGGGGRPEPCPAGRRGGGAAEQFLSSEGTEERRAAGRGAGALSS